MLNYMIQVMGRKNAMIRFHLISRLFVLLVSVVVVLADPRYSEMKGVNLRVTASHVNVVVLLIFFYFNFLYN